MKSNNNPNNSHHHPAEPNPSTASSNSSSSSIFGFLSRSRSTEQFHVPNPPHRVEDPNFHSTSSPDDTPPKKTWERHYKTFLMRRGGHHKNSDGSSPKSPKPQLSSSPKNHNMSTSHESSRKAGGFSIVPGTKRLLSRHSNTPSPSHNLKSITSPPPAGMPGIPALASKNQQQHRRSQSHAELRNQKQQQRSQSHSALEGLEGDEDTSVRGGKFFQHVFSRKGSEDHSNNNNLDASQSSRRRNIKSMSMDSSLNEMDGTRRRGVDKHSPDLRKDIKETPHSILQRPPDMNMHQHHHPVPPPPETSEDVGLDLLLASACSYSAPSHFPMPAARHPRPRLSSSQSRSQSRLSSSPSHLTCLQEDNNIDPYVLDNARRYHSQQQQQQQHELPQQQPANSVAIQLLSRPPQQQQRGCGGGGQLGMLLAAQLQVEEQQRSQQQQQQQPSQSLPSKGYLGQVLQDPLPQMNAVAITLPPKHPPKSAPIINPEMRKTFTEFHNTAKFARDSTSPFLGDDPSQSLNRHDPYMSYHPAMNMNRGGVAGSYHGTCLFVFVCMCHMCVYMWLFVWMLVAISSPSCIIIAEFILR